MVQEVPNDVDQTLTTSSRRPVDHRIANGTFSSDWMRCIEMKKRLLGEKLKGTQKLKNFAFGFDG